MNLELTILLQKLIREKTYSPQVGQCWDIISESLNRLTPSLSFYSDTIITDISYGPVSNALWTWKHQDEEENSLLSSPKQHLCFVGHVDVVSEGEQHLWHKDAGPFSGTLKNGNIYGRGTADMKGAIAAWIMALKRFHEHKKLPKNITLSLLLTSDEENRAQDGIKHMAQKLSKENFDVTAFLIGEPTGKACDGIGSVLQVARRGSITCDLIIKGIQGHIACSETFDNPIERFSQWMHAMNRPWDEGWQDLMPPTQLRVTSVDVGNAATNIIPGQCHVKFGVRYTPHWTEERVITYLEKSFHPYFEYDMFHATRHGGGYATSMDHSWVTRLRTWVNDYTGKFPVLTGRGGVTDGRFLRRFFPLVPIVELGLPEDTIHQINEHISLSHLETLSGLYEHIIQKWCE
jgi:succinyl-diaminopimelate desuccinylase